ncbi:protein kinase [Jatrophihabitans telluris]|uniref:non-specific serine/threonine protein kinase n=1 Tax=Jatrophihabitans telluris TaxID=2038343 RepID=A0ABY4R1X9_9ACTN|nr:serine/threonine-protein kinase [Jatrophihabitans telluris]UQX89286.1 protein kinase [Jatrophihabitans telluris]
MTVPTFPGLDDLRLIGQGGFSKVYAAYQPSLDRMVAIKVMNLEGKLSTAIDDELRAMAKVTEHPNLAQILDHGLDREGHPYLVMPLYRESLGDLISERGALDLETTLRMGVKLAGAVHSLGQLGLLHRDIKPSNVLLNRFGDVVLCDFGLARRTSDGVTPTNDLPLTPAYAPPEVIDGFPAGQAADVYALAATLYTCAAGKPPYTGETLAVLQRIMTEAAPRLSPEVTGADFADLIAAGMEHRASARPTALEFGRSLQDIQRSRQLPVTEMVLLVEDDHRQSATPAPASQSPEPAQQHGVRLPPRSAPSEEDSSAWLREATVIPNYQPSPPAAAPQQPPPVAAPQSPQPPDVSQPSPFITEFPPSDATQGRSDAPRYGQQTPPSGDSPYGPPPAGYSPYGPPPVAGYNPYGPPPVSGDSPYGSPPPGYSPYGFDPSANGPNGYPPGYGPVYSDLAPRGGPLRTFVVGTGIVLALIVVLPWRAAKALFTLMVRGLTSRRRSRAAEPEQGSWLGRVSADRPTTVDLLGHGPLMEGLAQVLNDPGTALPITIAVCGQWGSGKSSMMLQLAERLCTNPSPYWQRRWLAVRFDAWRFQGREALWAGLARAIYQQTCAELGSPLQRLRFRLRIERHRRGPARFFGGLLVVLVGAAFVGWESVAAWRGAGSWLTFAGLGAGAAALAVAIGYVGVLSQPFERAIARGSVTKKFDEFLGISDQAEQDIESLLTAIVEGRQGRCLVVFLDDLDRCQAALITEALAAITEIFGRHDGRRIAFVLGIDLDVVTSAVDSSLSALQDRMRRLNARRAGEMSEQFLEKVFQLSVAVDGHRRQRVERLLLGDLGPAVEAGWSAVAGGGASSVSMGDRIADLDVQNPAEFTMARHAAGINSQVLATPDLLALRAAVRERRSSLLSVESDDVRAAEQAAIGSLQLTPRAAKRFDNAFRLQMQVANSTPGSELDYGPDSLIAIAKWVALRMFFQPLVRLVDQRPGLLGELEEILISSRESSAFTARISELAPDALTPEAIADAARLLRVNLPLSQLSSLPLDSFATTTM